MSKIFITGARGFLGRHVCSILDTYGCNYTINTENLVTGDLKALFEKEKFTHVVHLAANPNGNAGYDGYIDNVKMTNTVLEAMLPGTCIVYSSSITVHASQAGPTTLYGASKKACEDLILAYSNRKVIKYNMLRLSALIGKNMTHGFLKDLLYKLSLSDDTITLFGDYPGMCKPYTHVLTVANHIVDLCLSSYNSEIYDYCSSNSLCIERVANMVMHRLNIHKLISWDNSKTFPGDCNLYSDKTNKCTESSEKAILKAIACV